jgi:hypothetical protein
LGVDVPGLLNIGRKMDLIRTVTNLFGAERPSDGFIHLRQQGGAQKQARHDKQTDFFHNLAIFGLVNDNLVVTCFHNGIHLPDGVYRDLINCPVIG